MCAQGRHTELYVTDSERSRPKQNHSERSGRFRVGAATQTQTGSVSETDRSPETDGQTTGEEGGT